MSLKGFLAELRHRGVLKVAAAYLAVGFVLLEGGSILLQTFEAPHWVQKVFGALVIVGLPVACLLAWGFDFTPEGVRPASKTGAPPDPRHSDAVFAAVLAVILVLVTAVVVQQWRTAPRQAAAPAVGEAPMPADTSAPAPRVATGPPSIAVLPFVDMSAEHDQQYLGDGIAEELLNALAAIDGINVAARTSSFAFGSKGATIQEIGSTLHVRHVLEGSVRRSGQKLRITAQLIDVDTGFHLFSQSYDREEQDLFAIQNEIAREIVSALLPKLGLGREVTLVRQGTTNLEAYNLRLKARQWLSSPDPFTIGPPLRQLREAVELDPRYADAWGDLAYVYAHSAVWSDDLLPPLMEAYRTAAVALSQAPDNVPALLVHAFVSMLVHRDAAASGRYMELARLAGADPSVWAYNNALLYDGPMGRVDAAAKALEDAAIKDPLAPNVRLALIEVYLAAGQVDDAVAVADSLGESAMQTPLLAFVAARAWLAAGDVTRARAIVDDAAGTAAARFPGYSLLQFAVDATAGDHAHAQALLDGLLRDGRQDCANCCYIIGEGYKTVGDYDRMIEWWSRSVERHEPWSLSFMPARNRNHPVIGKDPRFLELLRRMGLESQVPRAGG